MDDRSATDGQNGGAALLQRGVPDFSQAQRLERCGRLVEAERVCAQLLSAGPEDARLLHLLGTIVHRLGRNDQAIALLERASAIAPQKFAYRANLAAVLGRAGRPEQALPHLEAAVRLSPSSPEAHNNLGAALEQLNRLPEAVEHFRSAIGLRREYPEAWYNLANVLRKAGRLVAAVSAYEEAARLKGDWLSALAHVPPLLTELGDAAGTIAWCRRIIGLRPHVPAPRSALLYTLHYSAEYDAEALWREHAEWGRLFCDPQKDRIAPHENDRTPERKLRVGYVSPDFREHTVPHFVTAPLEHHDRGSFEVFCYSDVEKPDDITARSKGMVEQWAETRGMRDETLAARIRQDRIDILVDLRGHAADNRLPMFCLKPAPIQVNMVGYFDTTGLSTMDYRITDEHQDPTGRTEQYHTEKLIRIEPSCWCYTADEDAPEVAQPPALRNGYVTFGSFNKIVKVSEPCAKLWAAVLNAVPGSKLLVSVVSADAAGTVRKRLESYGLPSDRLIVADKTRTRSEYLQRFSEIDIALDTWPFNGITTTCDGLWMGVPCVSVTGETSVSRAGKSILHGAGMGELATESPERFVAVASQLARDVDRLAQMRRTMRDRLLAAALMDHRGFARKLEAAYRDIWRAWCSQPRRRVDAGPH